MVKRYTYDKVELKPDVRYNSTVATKFINCLMERGKKSTAEKIFYGALDMIGQKIKDTDPFEVFEQALGNVKPRIEVRSRRVGGQTYQIPVEVSRKRQQALAIRWMLSAAKARKGRPMHQRLAEEFMAAFRKEGAAITQRENTHRMAEANKAFAHFAW
ncbi:MAG: 30S ribosomal protein S7 [Planctomycetota bacterium]